MSNLSSLEPLRPAFRLKCLTDTQLDRMQAATLEIMEKTGVKFPSPIALQIFADHGAQVDWKTQIVRLPPDLVFKALASVPRYFTLGARLASMTWCCRMASHTLLLMAVGLKPLTCTAGSAGRLVRQMSQ